MKYNDNQSFDVYTYMPKPQLFPITNNKILDKYLSILFYCHQSFHTKVTSCDSAAADIYKLIKNSDLSSKCLVERHGDHECLLTNLTSSQNTAYLIDLGNYDQEDDIYCGIHSFVVIKTSRKLILMQAYGDNIHKHSALKLIQCYC